MVVVHFTDVTIDTVTNRVPTWWNDPRIWCMNYMYLQGCEKTWKMDSGPGSPFGLEDKAPWTCWMFNLRGFTNSPNPHKQETRGLDTIQTTSFFLSLVASSLLSRKKILKLDKILQKSKAYIHWAKEGKALIHVFVHMNAFMDIIAWDKTFEIMLRFSCFFPRFLSLSLPLSLSLF